jgi:hypothetical protein
MGNARVSLGRVENRTMQGGSVVLGMIAKDCGTVCLASALLACHSPAPSSQPQPTTPPAAIVVQRRTLSSPPTNSVASPANNRDLHAEAPWWERAYPDRFDAARLEHALPEIRVVGNHFLDTEGNTVVFQGVSIADPDKLMREGHWQRELFEAIRTWGANIVRVPIHPAAFRGLGRDAYFRLLDDAVVWATANSLYLIVDWHSIGNLSTGLFQHPMYDTSKQETYEFWRSVAHRYKDVSTLAFFELFNEPTTDHGNLGVMTWQQWKVINEELIDIIRSHGSNTIPLVAGLDWAYDLSPVSSVPVQRQQIAYVSHPYPQKAPLPYEAHWDRSFGFVAAKYPLVATEIGYMPATAAGAHVPVQDDGDYGPLITSYLARKGASWVAWCFHPRWAPPLIEDWAYHPTHAGNHFREVMLEHAGRRARAE